MTQKAACPQCGGSRLERDQPSPTHSDGDLRNMVDPGIGMDQGGNPLQEGVWAGSDSGWQPATRRDESYASVRTAMDFDFGGDGGFDFSDKVPTHKFIVDQSGKVYSGANPTTHEAIADTHRLHDQNFPHGMSLGELNDDGSTGWYQHETPHSAQALESMLYGHFGMPVQIDPDLKPTTNEERWGIQPGAQPNGPQRELNRLEGPPSPRSYGTPLDRNEGLVRGGSVLDQMIPQDPYMPWWVESSEKTAEIPVAPQEPQQPVGPQHKAMVTPGPQGIHAGTTKWLTFLDAHVNGRSARNDFNGIFTRHGMPSSPEFGQPVEVAVHDPSHLPAAINTIETSAGGAPAPEMKNLALAISQGQLPPPPGIDPSKLKFGSTKFGGLLGDALGIGAAGLGVALAPETGGLSLGLAGGLASKALPGLMKGALMGTGSEAAHGLLGGGGDVGQQDGALQGPRDVSQLSSVHNADLETPLSNPGYHDSPDGDTKQFDDQSTSTAFQNPNRNGEAGGSADGEDGVGAGIGPQFSPQAMERAHLLMPLIMHHYHSEESGANDALLRELHEQLEQESPGYLKQGDPEAVDALIHKLREPHGVSASTRESIMDPYAQQMQQQGVQPGVIAPQATPAPMGAHPQGGTPCPYCGGVTTADGSCPQCGSKVNPMGGAVPGATTPQIGAPQPSVTPPGWQSPLRAARTSADHQGPVTNEQISAVQDLLVQTGRAEECPKVPIEPWNYTREMAAVANKPNVTPNVDPSQQPPPQPAQEIAPPGATMPMPNPADPSMMPQASVHQAMSPMVDSEHLMAPTDIARLCGVAASTVSNWQVRHPDFPKPVAVVGNGRTALFLRDGVTAWLQARNIPTNGVGFAQPRLRTPAEGPGEEYIQPTERNRPNPYPRQQQPPEPLYYPAPPAVASVKQASPHPGAPRCPKCKSATTGVVTDGLGALIGECHSCNNIWPVDGSLSREAADDGNVVGVPAADQEGQRDISQEQDSSHTWQDDSGAPLVVGQTYEMHSPQYSIPDIIKVEQVKPDAIVVTMIGEYGNDPQHADNQGMSYTHEIPREEVDLEKLTFTPSTGDAGDQTLDQYADPASQAPVNTEPVEQSAIDPRHTHVVADVDDSSCPKCAGEHIASSMSSPTTSFHECYRCGHGWETKEEDFMDHNTASREWIRSDSGPGGDDFFAEMERHKAMREAGQGSRNLSDIAARDTRGQAIKERLEANAQERVAGRKFSPHEQRQFIDEQGVARNADKLDLANTHYEEHRYIGDKANSMNVPDEHMFMGI